MTAFSQKASLLKRLCLRRRRPPRKASGGFSYRVGRATETGDTLIELIIATVVIALASVALVGGIVGAVTGSGQHRGLATLDALLKSMAETAKVQIGGPGGQFNCAFYLAPAQAGVAESNTYQLLSEPNPSSGPAGTAVTVFATGMTASTTAFSVTMGGAPATNVTGSSDSLGNATVSFDVPIGLAVNQSYAVEVTSGTGVNQVLTDNTTSTFEVTSGAPPPNTSLLSDYHIGLTQIGYWNTNQFATATSTTSGAACASPSSAVQVLTLSGSAPNNVSDSLQVVVNGISGILTAVPPSFTSPPTATFTVGTTGSFNFMASGTPAPTFELCTTAIAVCGGVTSTLPTGLSLSGAGLLYGDPTTLGCQTSSGLTDPCLLQVVATNGVNPDAIQSFTLNVDEAPVFNPPTSVGFAVGTNNTIDITATGFPTPTISSTSITPALPTGVTFTAGVLTGTPPAGSEGTYVLDLLAANGVGQPVPETFTLTIGDLPQITSASAATFVVGSTAKCSGTIVNCFQVTANGTPAATSFVETGALPSGVSLNSTTGVLSGKPASGTGGTYSITFAATNVIGTGPASNFTLTVDQAPSFTSSSSATFSVNNPGSFTVTASGTPTPTITTSSSLPSGVTFNGTLLSGTPAPGTGGTHSITFSASNGVSPAATQNFTLTVDEGPTFNPPSSATFTANTSANCTTSVNCFTVSATGTPAPTISESGSLPSNVTFNTGNDRLSGDPPTGTGGTYSITFTASNGVTAPVSESFTLTVDQAPAFTSANSLSVPLGTSFNFPVTASGYPAPTITEASTLPTGVSFNGSTLSVGANTPEGVYNTLSFTASNGVGTAAHQSFTLTVGTAPTTFTSASSTTFTVGLSNSFTVSANGYPTPNYTETGGLPSGVTLSTNGTLSGTPAANTGGSYNITITAANVLGSWPQQFTLYVVEQTPTFTVSVTPSSITYGAQATLSETGLPTSPTGTVTFTSGSTQLCVITLSATSNSCKTSQTLPVGTYAGSGTGFQGVYSGNGVDTSGTSQNSLTLTVGQATPPFKITINGSLTGASVGYGTSATLAESTTSSLPADATGYVVFSASGNPDVCTFYLPSTSCTTSSSLAVGTSYPSIQAEFYADANTNYTNSPASNAVSLTVTKASPTLTLTVGNTSSYAITPGSTAPLAVSGLSSLATGTLTFSPSSVCAASPIAVPDAANPICTTPASLAIGTYTITVTYSGDANDNAATSNSVTLVVGPKFVQQVTLNVAQHGANTDSLDLQLPNTVGAGDTLILTLADQSTNDSVISSGGISEDGVSSGWTNAVGTGGTADGDAEIWYLLNAPSGAGQEVTVSLTKDTNVQLADLSEWSGLAVSGAVDSTNEKTGTSATIGAGSVTPTQSGDLIISDAYLLNGTSNQGAPTGGFTLSPLTESAGASGYYRGYVAYLIDSSTSSASTQWTEPGGAGAWASAVAAFKS